MNMSSFSPMSLEQSRSYTTQTHHARLSYVAPEPDLHLRHPPTQARSRERLRLVMDVADELLARDGAESFTTTRIAEAAGIPVGTAKCHAHRGRARLSEQLVEDVA